MDSDDYHWRLALSVETVLELKSQGSLKMRLGSGLECLSMLKRLRTLLFEYTVQEMRTEEIEWMSDSWPMLKEVRGRFSMDQSRHREMTRVLQGRGILCEAKTWFQDLQTKAFLQEQLDSARLPGIETEL